MDLDKHRSPDYRDKPFVRSVFDSNDEMQGRASGVIEYLLANYDVENGFHGYINKKKTIEYRFNRAGENIFTCMIRQKWVTVRFNVNNMNIKGDFDVINRQGRKDKKTGEINVNRYIDFKIEDEEDLEDIDSFFASNPITNILHRHDYWGNISFELANNETFTVYTPSKDEIVIHGYEARLARKLRLWLNSNKSVKNISFETPAKTKMLNDRLDATFKLKGIGCVIAELKSIRGGSTNSKMCIRNALGQLLDYRHYGDGNEAEQMWIVIDAEPSKLDIQFIKKIVTTYGIPLKLVYEIADSF
ncbi:MAG: hypothetical protein HRT68_12885 [Flavobacteriaceae bacterium]|nr:hypothetical protein [Flavobacteriaceae bacterium]